MSVLLTLTYTGSICSIVGFIITPGLTIIYPWLKEKYNEDKARAVKRDLSKDYRNMSYKALLDEKEMFNKAHRFDWRPKISKQRHKLKNRLSIAKWNISMDK